MKTTHQTSRATTTTPHKLTDGAFRPRLWICLYPLDPLIALLRNDKACGLQARPSHNIGHGTRHVTHAWAWAESVSRRRGHTSSRVAGREQGALCQMNASKKRL